MARLHNLTNDIEVYVLTHAIKQSITFDSLQKIGMPYKVFLNQDWEWPRDHPELDCPRDRRPGVRGYALRQYRAFRGHQEIMKIANPTKFTVVFEDDMSVGRDLWEREIYSQLTTARRLITELGYEAVSFHGRNLSPPEYSFMVFGREYVRPSLQYQDGLGHQFFLEPVAAHYGGKYANHMYRWHEGCLAYMVGPAAKEKWSTAGHGFGLPCDLFLANELHTIVMRRSFFIHDTSHGSLIDNWGQASRQLTPDGMLIEGAACNPSL